MLLDADSPQAWLKYAESDIALAEAKNDNRVMFENLCFHAQQAIEKSIKAILVLCNMPFPKTHNLELLIDLLPSHMKRTDFLLESRTLSGYATVIRYPGMGELTTEDEYKRALKLAITVFQWAKKIVESTL